MPYGVLPVDTTRKPLSCERVRVNWEHPHNRGLIAEYLLNSPLNLVSERLALLVGASLTNSRGEECATFATDDYISCPTLGAGGGGGTTGGLKYDAPNTFIFTVYAASGPTNPCVLHANDSNGDRIITAYFATSYFSKLNVTRGASSTARTRVGNLTLGNYGHVACVYDPGLDANRYTVYVNGLDTSADSAGGTAGTGGSAGDFWLGARSSSTLFLTGQIFHVSVYARALSPLEVMMLYQNPYGTPGNPRLI